jgi:DNA polymerase-4
MENDSAGQSLAAASDLEAPFYPLVRPLLCKAWSRRQPLRLVSVRFSGVENGPAQLEMFAEADEKRRRLATVLDQLNQRAAKPIVQHGHQLGQRRK